MNKRHTISAILLLAYWSAVLVLAWGARFLAEPYGALALMGVIELTLPLGLILPGIYMHGAESDFYLMAFVFALINSCVCSGLFVWLRSVRQRSNSESLK